MLWFNIKRYINIWSIIGISIFGGIIYLLFFTNLPLMTKIIVGMFYLAYHRIGLAIDENSKRVIGENYHMVQDVINILTSRTKEKK